MHANYICEFSIPNYLICCISVIFCKIFAAMFKSAKAAIRAKKESTFKQPIIKKCKGVSTHLKEHSAMEKIRCLSHLPKKRKLLYRTVLGMPSDELDKNVFMIADLLFSSFLRDNSIDKLYYCALDRLFKSQNGLAIHELAVEYLIAQLGIDGMYKTFAEYLLKKCESAIFKKRTIIAELLDDPGFAKHKLGGKNNIKNMAQSSSEPFYYTRLI